MSFHSFLPKHPKIVKKTNQNQIKQASQSFLGKTAITSKISEWSKDDQVIQNIINNQKKQFQELQNKTKQLTQKNILLSQSLRFYDSDTQRNQIMAQIQKAKQQQEQIMAKIKNCAKVQESTTPQEYYLWQKKKKMDEYNHKLDFILQQNQSERDHLHELCEALRKRILQAKQEIQIILFQIEKTQSEFNFEQDLSDNESITHQKINSLREQFHSLDPTVSMLRQNNQIMSNQLIDGMQSQEKSLKKSFQNAKSALVRDLQIIKSQIQNPSRISLPMKGKQKSFTQAMNDYIQKMKEVKNILTQDEAADSAGIITAFNWASVKWEQYAENSQSSFDINYKQKYENLLVQKQLINKQTYENEQKIKILIDEIMTKQQKNMQIQSANIKTSKLISSF